jgi:glutamine---fructose-6-phosphate transaminase (isomerizing)
MIEATGTLMFREAGEAAEAVAAQQAANRTAQATIAGLLRSQPPRLVVTCARGSSDHAATFAKYLIETRLGLPTASAAPSIASLYLAPALAGGSLWLAISQSGRSPDLIASLEAAKAGGARIVALVNAPDSPLAAIADHELPLHAGPERSVPATKSFIASLAALAALVAEWAGDEELGRALESLPGELASAWSRDWSALADGLGDARGLYVIGRGLGLGVAQEAALKLKETCGLHAEAFSAAELRHGPMALVGPDFPLLVFRQSDETEASIDEAIAEVRARGAPVFVAGGGADGAVLLPSPEAHPAIEPMLQIQSFYRAAASLAVLRGFDPDRPPHLAKVTETL